ncbi:MAG: type IV-A pilus assembly ATPase PilB [Bdellovibrionales bacterium]
MSAKKNNVGQLLVRESLVTPEQLDQAVEYQSKNGGSLNEAMIALGFVDGDEVAKRLAKEFSVPYLDLSQFQPNADVVSLVSPAFCRKHVIIPVSKVGQRCLVVACSDPGNVFVKNDLESVTQMTIQIVAASPVRIKEAIDKFFAPKKAEINDFMTDLEKAENDYVVQGDDTENIDADSDDGVVIKFVNAILSEAIQTKASDIHIEVYEKKCRVRYRIDGKLQEKLYPPRGTAGAIASRIKIMSKLDIAEKRRPQDGRLKVKKSTGKEVDFRVSVIPVLFGEKIVMRLLDKSNLSADVHKLGFTDRELDIILRNIGKPQGIVLMTGPTGSGKTTTIYSILNELNDTETNISTAEDPVEYNVEGINQVQVNAEIGFTFSGALRSFLRQDPDVIMVGEIRDSETAEISFKAASTGHLVVSTLHTNDSIATITRLVDIGIPPYMVSEVVSLVMAQRLIRLNCESCSKPIEVPKESLIDIGVKEEEVGEYTNLVKGEGCSACNNSGYKGRMPIFEILEMTSDLRKAIINEEPNSVLKKKAIESGLVTLRQSALARLKAGITTIEEVVNTSVRDDI